MNSFQDAFFLFKKISHEFYNNILNIFCIILFCYCVALLYIAVLLYLCIML